MLTPFNYAVKVAEGVETFFSMQRQTLHMAFGNNERSRISRYESLGQTQISLQSAIETIGRQILTNQLAVRNSINQILKDIKIFNRKDNTILLSPASASYDQYLNFEHRGDEFKKLCKLYARKYL